MYIESKQIDPRSFCINSDNQHHLIFALFFQVKKLHHDRKLNLMVDKDLRGNFDRIELEEIVQVALLCTQYFPKKY